MARRKKKSTPRTDNGLFDDLDPLLDSDEDFSPDATPHQSYDDIHDIGGFSDDPFGLGLPSEERPQDDLKAKDEAYNKKMRKFLLIVIPVIFIVVLGIAVSMMGGGGGVTTGDGGTGEDPGSSRIEGDGEGVNINEAVGSTHTGTENGNPANGTGAILAFDHQYYTERSGEGARSHFNPDATSYDAAFIQAAIDRVPGGTTYSLDITPMTIGQRYDVVLTLTIPGMDPVSYNQDFEVMESDGRYYVKSFTSQRAAQ